MRQTDGPRRHGDTEKALIASGPAAATQARASRTRCRLAGADHDGATETRKHGTPGANLRRVERWRSISTRSARRAAGSSSAVTDGPRRHGDTEKTPLRSRRAVLGAP